MNVCPDLDRVESSTDFDEGLRLETRRAGGPRFNVRQWRRRGSKAVTIPAPNRWVNDPVEPLSPTELPFGNVRVIASGTLCGELIAGSPIGTVEFGEATDWDAGGDSVFWWKSACYGENSTVSPRADMWTLVVCAAEAAGSALINAEALRDDRLADRVRLPNANIPFAKWEAFDEPEWDPDRFRAQLAVNEFYGGEDADSDTP